MSWALLAAASVGGGVVVASAIRRTLTPPLAVLAYALAAATVALAVIAVIVLLALHLVAGLDLVATIAPMCRPPLGGHEAPAWVGLVAVAAMAALPFPVARTLRRQRRLRDLVTDGSTFMVLATDEPTAFAVPGTPGCIVVSSGMLKALDGDERRALLAHEQAHLDRRHHRYLQVMGLAAAAVPVLRPLCRRARFAAERWADEDAALAVEDRELVARAVAKAALASGDHGARSLAITGSDVSTRVDALLDQPTRRPALPSLASLSLAAATPLVVALAAQLQPHHLVAFATHLCLSA